jgi:hypothetical protein
LKKEGNSEREGELYKKNVRGRGRVGERERKSGREGEEE